MYRTPPMYCIHIIPGGLGILLPGSTFSGECQDQTLGSKSVISGILSSKLGIILKLEMFLSVSVRID